MAHVVKFYGRLRLNRSVLKASIFSVLIEITFQLSKLLCVPKDH